jgi:hypothetical protein
MRPSLCLFVALAGLGCGASVTPNNAPPADVPVAPADAPAAVVDVPVAVADAPVAPIDVPPVVTGDLPLGEACERDEQCATGVCARTPGVASGCAQPCADDSPCFDMSSLLSCVLDRAPAGGRFVCGQVVGAEVERAGECNADAQCFSGYCFEGACHNACADDAGCPAGWRCGAMAVGARSVQACRATPITGVTVEDFVLFQGNASVDRSTMALPVIAPPDTVSLTWVTQDLGGASLYATVSSVVDPDGRTLVDRRTWSALREQQVRTIPSRLEINGATFPGRDMEPMVPGVFRSMHALLNDPTRPR